MPTKRTGPERCRRKFLSFFPGGFRDEKYVDWERGYKWTAHERWNEELSKEKLQSLIRDGNFAEVAKRAVTIPATRPSQPDIT